MKISTIFILLACLVLTSAFSAAEPDDGYRVVVKFHPCDATPGETGDDGIVIGQPWANQSLDHLLAVAAGLGDPGSCKNSYRLFYSLVPLRKLTGVFVI